MYEEEKARIIVVKWVSEASCEELNDFIKNKELGD